MFSPDQLGGWFVAFIFGGAATFERFRNIKQARQREANTEVISDARKHAERADLMAKLAEDYKKLFEKEHQEHSAYRDFAHAKANKDQVLLSQAQERVVELQSRPDFSDLFEHLKTQSDASVKILDAIQSLVTMMKSFMEKQMNDNS